MSTPRATNSSMHRICAALLMLCVGCAQATNVVSSELDDDAGMDAGADTGTDGGVIPDANLGDGAPDVSSGEGGTALCNGAPCQCDNNVDDDQDGLTDGFDPECTGAFDEDEGSFATGERPGNPNCSDCFFDGDPNPQNDGCNVSAHCSVNGTPSPQGNCNTCTPTAQCISNCLRLTPNGCDCFGCCAIPFQGGTVTVQLVETCTMKELGNPAKCPVCKLADDSGCFNPCARCELCAGKTINDLPMDCGAGYSCANGKACSESSACPVDHYCSQGCCIEYLK